MHEVALGVFVLTYALISLQRVRGFVIDRPVASLLGAGLMVGLGVLPWDGALAAVAGGVEILTLLLGMLVMAAALDVAGFFDALSATLERRARTARRFFVQVCLASAVLSALFLNDAVVLLLTQPVIRVARRLGADPVPFLVGEVICANIGSAATIVGNPQNAYIGIASGIPFARFALVMVPVAAACLAVAVPVMLFLYRKELSRALPAGAAAPGRPLLAAKAWLAYGAGLGPLVALFVASSYLGVSVAAVAMGGAVAFLVASSARGPHTTRTVLERVDWTILLMFAGLFIVLAGLTSAGALDFLVGGVRSLGGGGDLPTLGGVALAAALGSNAISNVPAVLLLSPAAATLGSERVWMALAASSTMAGNATILGAAANLIVAERAEREGVTLGWARFLRVGLPVSALTVALSTVLIWALPL